MVSENCGGGRNFVYANVDKLGSKVPKDYQCHGNGWVSAHVMHHSTGFNGSFGQPKALMHDLQRNFFAASSALNAQMNRCEKKLVEWVSNDQNCGRIDATNFNVGDCGD